MIAIFARYLDMVKSPQLPKPPVFLESMGSAMTIRTHAAKFLIAAYVGIFPGGVSEGGTL